MEKISIPGQNIHRCILHKHNVIGRFYVSITTTGHTFDKNQMDKIGNPLGLVVLALHKEGHRKNF